MLLTAIDGCEPFPIRVFAIDPRGPHAQSPSFQPGSGHLSALRSRPFSSSLRWQIDKEAVSLASFMSLIQKAGGPWQSGVCLNVHGHGVRGISVGFA